MRGLEAWAELWGDTSIELKKVSPGRSSFAARKGAIFSAMSTRARSSFGSFKVDNKPFINTSPRRRKRKVDMVISNVKRSTYHIELFLVHN